MFKIKNELNMKPLKLDKLANKTGPSGGSSMSIDENRLTKQKTSSVLKNATSNIFFDTKLKLSSSKDPENLKMNKLSSNKVMDLTSDSNFNDAQRDMKFPIQDVRSNYPTL